MTVIDAGYFWEAIEEIGFHWSDDKERGFGFGFHDSKYNGHYDKLVLNLHGKKFDSYGNNALIFFNAVIFEDDNSGLTTARISYREYFEVKNYKKYIDKITKDELEQLKDLIVKNVI